MNVALENGQTEKVRADAAHQHVVAVVEQVVSRDGGPDIAAGSLDELHGVARGDVLEHHFKAWETLGDTAELLIDEVLFAIEDVNFRARHFAMDQQRQANLGHGLEHREDVVDAGDAGCRIGGGPGRIKLGGEYIATGFGSAHIFGLRAVGEVEHHQWLKGAASRAGGKDALAIAVRLASISDRRDQVRHDDGARELACSVCHGVWQRCAVAQMDVPVVGAQ